MGNTGKPMLSGGQQFWMGGTQRTSSCIIDGKATCEGVGYTLSVKSVGIIMVNRTLWKVAMSLSASRSILAASNEFCGYNDSAL
uniref:Uncharacterized protein n=1 Tax=Romanomermis culicivorax TaxID=13658 RepID=A0A915IWJ1_ROMCU